MQYIGMVGMEYVSSQLKIRHEYSMRVSFSLCVCLVGATDQIEG